MTKLPHALFLTFAATVACGDMSPEEAAALEAQLDLSAPSGVAEQAYLGSNVHDRVCLTAKNKKGAETAGTIKVLTYDDGRIARCDIDGIGRGERKCCSLDSKGWEPWDETPIGLASPFTGCAIGNDDFNVFLRLNSHDDAWLTTVEIIEDTGRHVTGEDFYCSGTMNSCEGFMADETRYNSFWLGMDEEREVRLFETGGNNMDAYGNAANTCMTEFEW